MLFKSNLCGKLLDQPPTLVECYIVFSLTKPAAHSSVALHSLQLKTSIPSVLPATGGHLFKADNKPEHVALQVGDPRQLMEDVPMEKRLMLTFPHISAWVPDLFGPGAQQGGNFVTKAFQKLKGGKPKPQKAKERQVGTLLYLMCTHVSGGACAAYIAQHDAAQTAMHASSSIRLYLTSWRPELVTDVKLKTQGNTR